jgi:hypothetical protein
VGHDRIQTRISHGNTAAAARRLGTVDKGIDSSVASVLLLYLGISSPSDKEDGSAYDGGNHNNTDNSASSDGGCV